MYRPFVVLLLTLESSLALTGPNPVRPTRQEVVVEASRPGNDPDWRQISSTLLVAASLALAPAASLAVSGGGLDYANLDITGQDFSNGNYKGKDFTQGRIRDDIIGGGCELPPTHSIS